MTEVARSRIGVNTYLAPWLTGGFHYSGVIAA